MLATLAQVRQLLGFADGDTEHDALLTAILRRVSDRLARYAGRVSGGLPCLEKSAGDIVQYFSPEARTGVLWLPARPVVIVTEIKEAAYGEFTAATALVENTDYQLAADRGELIRIGTWLAGDLTVRVTYTGGYTPCAAWASSTAYVTGDVAYYGRAVYTCSSSVTGTTAPPADTGHWTLATGQRPLPEDIAEAAVLQAAYWFQRRDSLGLASAGSPGGSFGQADADALLAEVRCTMDAYRQRLG